MNPLYFYGKGRVKLALYDDNGDLGPFQFYGNVPSLQLSPKVEYIEHREDQTGYNFKDLEIPHMASLDGTMTFEDVNPEVLALALFGTITPQAAQTAQTTELEDPEAGNYYEFGPPGATITGVDVGGSPLASSGYSTDGDGTIKFAANQTGTVEITWNAPANNSIGILDVHSRIASLRFGGLNAANSRKAVLIKLSRVRVSPTKVFEAIANGNKVASFEVDFSCLYDPQDIEDGIITGYGSIVPVV